MFQRIIVCSSSASLSYRTAMLEERVYYIGVGDECDKQILEVVMCTGQGTIKLHARLC